MSNFYPVLPVRVEGDGQHLVGTVLTIQISHSLFTISSPHSRKASSALQLLCRSKKIPPLQPTAPYHCHAQGLFHIGRMNQNAGGPPHLLLELAELPQIKENCHRTCPDFPAGDHRFCSLTNLQGPVGIPMTIPTLV